MELGRGLGRSHQGLTCALRNLGSQWTPVTAFHWAAPGALKSSAGGRPPLRSQWCFCSVVSTPMSGLRSASEVRCGDFAPGIMKSPSPAASDWDTLSYAATPQPWLVWGWCLGAGKVQCPWHYGGLVVSSSLAPPNALVTRHRWQRNIPRWVRWIFTFVFSNS
jgi:hypothetical protein